MMMQRICTGYGQTVLTVDGWVGSSRPFDTISASLVQMQIAVDPMDQGETAEEAQRGTFDSWAGNLDDRLCAGDCAYVDRLGISLGACVVWQIARRGRVSSIVHVDDTVSSMSTYNQHARPPWHSKRSLSAPRLRFHPMLARALQKRLGATDDYDR